ncbi:MAG: FG-GAP-like repeat-containing protein [Acidimicrobiales bacterium]
MAAEAAGSSYAVSFAPGVSYTLGDNPHGVAIGDLTNDGAPAVVAAAGGGVETLLNDGNGGLGSPSSDLLNAGDAPSVALADMNADGNLDVVAGASVLPGRGDGSFDPEVDTVAGGGPSVVADFDYDGRPDIATLDGGRVAVVKQQPTPLPPLTFRAPSLYGPSGAFAIAEGDLRAPGSRDLVVTTQDPSTAVSYAQVLLNNGDGTFQPAVPYAIGGPAQSIAIGDLRGDGRQDIVTADTQSDTVSVLLNQGNGTFAPAQQIITPAFDPQAVTIADMNGDDIPDLVTADGAANSVSIFLGNGDGTFAAPITVPTGSTTASPFATTVAVGDLTGDGRPSIVVGVKDLTGGRSGGLSVLLQTPPTGFLARRVFGEVQDGETSAPQTETITNEGAAAELIGTITTSGADAPAFTTSSDTCSGQTLQPAAICTVQVQFAPTQDRSYSADLVVPAGGVSEQAALSGTGTNPALGLSATSLPMSVDVGQQFNATETLTNTGDGTLAVTGISLTGPDASAYTITSANGCANLRHSESCTIGLMFVPTQARSYSAALTFTSNVATSPTAVDLTSIGEEPAVGLSTTSVSLVGGSGEFPSAPVVVTDTGDGPLTIDNVQITGSGASSFIADTGCPNGITVQVGESCTITVSYGTNGSAATATLTITSNAPSSPDTVALQGTVQTSGLLVTPNPLTLTAAPGGSITGFFNMKALGPGSTIIFGIAPTSGPITDISNDPNNTGANVFTISDLFCTSNPIPAGSACSATVTFNAPATTGETDATVTVFNNAGSPQVETIRGISAQPAPTLTSITVTPTNPTEPTGAPQQFTATGTFSDASTQDLTTTASWSSSNTGVATINATTGAATTIAAGTTTITATDGTITGTTTLTVINKVGTTTSVVSSVNPATEGQATTFTATVTARAASHGTPSGTVDFSSGSTDLGTAALGPNATAAITETLPKGNATIRATYSGSAAFTGSKASVKEVIQNAPLSLHTVAISGTEPVTVAGIVAHLIDGNPAVASSFRATIDWGDGTTSAGVISADPMAGFDVSGRHTYTKGGTHTFKVKVTDLGGSSVTGTGTATIQAPPKRAGLGLFGEPVPLL